MSIEVKVPELPESVADGLLLEWHKQVGEVIACDENLVDIETDKVVLEIPAPDAGIIRKIIKKCGDVVNSGEVLAIIDPDPTVAIPRKAVAEPIPATSPAVRQLVADNNLDLTKITGTGKGGRIVKQDVLDYMASSVHQPSDSIEDEVVPVSSDSVNPVADRIDERYEERVPMTRLRARIAERLVKSQQTAAILTTFNEVDMQPVMDLRVRYRDQFERKHEVKLGFMSFFVKACMEALKQFPVINASVDGNDIVYHSYYDIGVAIGSPRGLVVPILRNVDSMSFADIEKSIRDFGVRAHAGKLGLDELSGGTFSISNGGIFGSMLSTPIINPPQSAILGMHNITDRAVVKDGKVVVRPVMYLALSYDHRIVDGRDAVQFLVRVKSGLEEPATMLLDV